MNRNLKKRGKTVLWVLAMFVTLLTATAPLAAHAAEHPLKLMVEQAFTADASPAEATFAYRLKPLEPGNPMPAGSTADGYTFTITGNNSAEIGPLAYGYQGVYSYELFQVVGTEKPGYIYDKRIYTIVVYVDATLTAIVVINQDGTKADSIRFENGFKALPGDPESTTKPSASDGTKPGGDGPKMGDDWNAAYIIALFALGGVLVIGAAVYLLVYGKRKKAG